MQRNQGRGTPMGHIEARFRAPSLLGDWLDFDLSVEEIGRPSVTVAIACACKGQPRFFCRATMVHADLGAVTSLPWADETRLSLTHHIAQSPKD